ncbi:MAG: hypothetical protein JWP40_283, partial [Blastococcus sp.]|nr:hypothetical protein [Blastococcus sp.]
MHVLRGITGHDRRKPRAVVAVLAVLSLRPFTPDGRIDVHEAVQRWDVNGAARVDSVSEGPGDRQAGAASTPGNRAASSRTRPAWWGEAAVLVGLLWVYDAVRSLAPARRSQAVATGHRLLVVERGWHLDIEHTLNEALVRAGPVAQFVADYYYAILHIWLTLGLLAWVYWRRPEHYRRLRNLLVMTNMVALVVFWLLPLAPPRLLPGAGFVDTVAAGHTIGSWGSPATADANFYAAMPSLHEAWALWVAIAVRRTVTHPGARRWAGAYPALTTLVVLSTANHYLLDTVAGALTVGVAAGLTACRPRVRDTVRCRRRRTSTPRGHARRRVVAVGVTARSRPGTA